VRALHIDANLSIMYCGQIKITIYSLRKQDITTTMVVMAIVTVMIHGGDDILVLAIMTIMPI